MGGGWSEGHLDEAAVGAAGGTHLDGRRVVDVVAQDHQRLRQVLRHVVGRGVDEGAEAEYARVPLPQLGHVLRRGRGAATTLPQPRARHPLELRLIGQQGRNVSI